MVSADYWVHQINLIVGNYLSIEATFIDFSKQAMELISWL